MTYEVQMDPGARPKEGLGEVLSKEIRTSVVSYFSPVLAVVQDVARSIREDDRTAETARREPPKR